MTWAGPDAMIRSPARGWDRVIPGHPGPGGRLGTKQDVRDLLTFLREFRRYLLPVLDEIRTAAR